jgi:hypothetical protein
MHLVSANGWLASGKQRAKQNQNQHHTCCFPFPCSMEEALWMEGGSLACLLAGLAGLVGRQQEVRCPLCAVRLPSLLFLPPWLDHWPQQIQAGCIKAKSVHSKRRVLSHLTGQVRSPTQSPWSRRRTAEPSGVLMLPVQRLKEKNNK